MLGSATLFAGMALAVEHAHRLDPSLSAWVSTAVRSVVSLVVLLALVRGDPRGLLGDARPALWARGLLGAVSLLSYFAAISMVGAGEATFLMQTSAVWVVVLSPFVLKESSPPLIWAAVVTSLIGVSLLMGASEGDPDLLGRVLGLCSGLAAAGAMMSVRRASRTNTPTVIVFWFSAIGTLVTLAVLVVSGATLPRSPPVWGALVTAALAATFAQLMMTGAYQVGRAPLVAAAGSSSPLLAALGAWWLFGQHPSPRAQLGMALILVSGAVIPLLTAARHDPTHPAASAPHAK
ncbi:DMT family transporter [Myxococcota bacterium]|nr:DMT family transporter [Myxococcota bacterium]